jgi:ABC-type transport system involved in multi-copper enzyme maturation permease subunit
MVVAPMYAAVAFARERRERTAEFLATLPVSRAHVIGSKLAMATLLTAAPLALSLLIAFIGGLAISKPLIDSWDFADPWRLILSGGIMLLGLGWLMSALMRSEVMAAAFAIFAGMITVGTVLTVVSRRGVLEHAGAWPYVWTMGAVGVTALVAGTVIVAAHKNP